MCTRDCLLSINTYTNFISSKPLKRSPLTCFVSLLFARAIVVVSGSDAVREAVEKAFAEEIGKLVGGINDRVAEIWTGTAPESKVKRKMFAVALAVVIVDHMV